MVEVSHPNYLPVSRGDALSNLASVGAVVHQEKFKIFFVSDEELSEARSEHVSGLLSLLAADLGLSDLTTEASSHTRVNTSLFPPRSLQKKDTWNTTLAIKKEIILSQSSHVARCQALNAREHSSVEKRNEQMKADSFLTLTRLNSSDWNLLILFVFFLIILVLFKGCTAIILYLIHNRSPSTLLY